VHHLDKNTFNAMDGKRWGLIRVRDIEVLK
jgi:hypothetical protein